MKPLILGSLLAPFSLTPDRSGYWTEIPDWYPVYHRTEVLEPIPNEMPLYKWLDGRGLWD